jgi:MarR family transcriptional regulator, lower aerobic nicotinate degradation pathway regulator
MSNPSANDYEFSEQIGHLLRRAYERHVAIFQEMVPDRQLTAAQFVVLCTVRDNAPCEIPVIVASTAIEESTVRGIVERLKWRKFVSVAQDAGDTRHLAVSLTPAGAETIEQTVPFAQQISERTFDGLDAGERKAIVELLRKMSGIRAG